MIVDRDQDKFWQYAKVATNRGNIYMETIVILEKNDLAKMLP